MREISLQSISLGVLSLFSLIVAEPHQSQDCGRVSSGAENVYVLMAESLNSGARFADDPQKVISFDGRPAHIHCNEKCCSDFDDDTFPCDVALTTFPTRPAPGHTAFKSLQASCIFLSCVHPISGDYVCQFADINGPEEPGYGQYITWINPNSKKTRHLLQADLPKSKVETQVLSMHTAKNQTLKEEADTVKELNMAEKIIEDSKKKEDKEITDLREISDARRRVITPLILIICGISGAFIFLYLRYRKLKQHIRYDQIKQHDYYSKLDPDDMAAENEAQQLINGAYDI